MKAGSISFIAYLKYLNSNKNKNTEEAEHYGYKRQTIL